VRRIVLLVVVTTAIAVVVAGYLWARQDEPLDAGQGGQGDLAPGVAAPATSAPSDGTSSTPPSDGADMAAAPGGHASAEPGYDRAGAPSPAAPASWGREERVAAARASEAIVDSYLDTDTRWWARLSRLLTPSARTVYNTVPPEVLPATTRTGSAQVTSTGSALLAVATVPTGVGPYEVTLVRADGAGQWLADRIVPVDS
jgi:hypothetical protein